MSASKEELEQLLPELCYAVLPGENKAIMVKRFEKGYWPARTTPEFVHELNAELGVTKEQSFAMLHGSMFGWDVPGADPRNEVNATLAAKVGA
jgi:hypothetical protein